MAPKKLIDVEDLIVWVAGELSRKRPNDTGTTYRLEVSRRDRECLGRWNSPMGYPPMSPMFAGGLGSAGVSRGSPPHDDALAVEAAIDALAELRDALGPAPEDLGYGLGFAFDLAGAWAAATANFRNLLLQHGKLGSRPSVTSEPPSPSAVRAANGKPGVWRTERWDEPTFADHARAEREVEVAVVATRRGVYPTGAFCKLEWSPSPQWLVNERAEYAAWRMGLERLAERLAGKLEAHAALPPAAALRPWIGERDGDRPRELYGPAAERVYAGADAEALAAERASGRRRPVYGGAVYRGRPTKPVGRKTEVR